MCKACGKTGHFTIDCNTNKTKCYRCGESGHTLRECPQFQARARAVTTVSARRVTRGRSDTIFITSDSFSNAYSHILPDSGAEFSTIGMHVVEKEGLKITPIAPSDIQTLDGAEQSMSAQRIGTVKLRVSVHYPFARSPRQLVCTFDKTFEVMNQQEDFLLGAETFNTLFPNSILNTLIAHRSVITDWPKNVKWSGSAPSDAADHIAVTAHTRRAAAATNEHASSSSSSSSFSVNDASTNECDEIDGFIEDLADEGEINHPERYYTGAANTPQ